MSNKDELSQILGRRQWFNVPPADVLGRLKGDVNYGNGRSAKGTDLYMKFWAGHASYPFKSHDAWFLAENVRILLTTNGGKTWTKLAKTTNDGSATVKLPAGKTKKARIMIEAVDNYFFAVNDAWFKIG